MYYTNFLVYASPLIDLAFFSSNEYALIIVTIKPKSEVKLLFRSAC